MFLKTLVIPAISVIHGWKAVSFSSEDIKLDFGVPTFFLLFNFVLRKKKFRFCSIF